MPDVLPYYPLKGHLQTRPSRRQKYAQVALSWSVRRSDGTKAEVKAGIFKEVSLACLKKYLFLRNMAEIYGPFTEPEQGCKAARADGVQQ